MGAAAAGPGGQATVKLNLGCGNKPLEGYINHDLTVHADHVDIAWDLNELPWPWQDEAFEKVAAISVLEHLRQNLLTSMDELWRILEPHGVAVVKLPHWKHNISWEDLTHLHVVGVGAMDQLDPRTKRGVDYWFYTRRKWRVDKRTVNDAKSSIYWTTTKMPLDWDPLCRRGGVPDGSMDRGGASSVDIVVLTCDRARLLKQTVKYIVTRTRTPYRLHIIDDASEEGNVELAQGWVDRKLVASLTQRRHRMGIAAGLRDILRLTTSDPVVFTDDDILCPDSEPDWLARGLQAMEKEPTLGILALNNPHCNVGGSKRGHLEPGDPVTRCWQVPGSLVFVRRQVLKECAPPDGLGSPVKAMCHAARAGGWEVGYLTKVYCQHIGRVSVRNGKDLGSAIDLVAPIDGRTLEPPEEYRG